MAPEHEGRLRADFNDHESDEPRRRRRPAADWGVNEDIFDRMPSRFARVNRRAEHHEKVVVLRTGEGGGRRREVASWGADAWAEAPAQRDEVVWDSERETWRTERASAEVSAALDEWRDDAGSEAAGYRRENERAREQRGGEGRATNARGARDDARVSRASGTRSVDVWAEEERATRVADSRTADSRLAHSRAADTRGGDARGGDTRVANSRAADTRGTDTRGADTRVADSRVADTWAAHDEPDSGGHVLVTERPKVDSWMDDLPRETERPKVDSWMDDLPRETEKPKVDSWMDDVPLVPGESRTIVLGNDESPSPARPHGTQERRTVKISGHPDRVPAVRAQRPPRSAVERIGASPDRIVAWAVALGFLLVLIAVLTTGQ